MANRQEIIVNQTGAEKTARGLGRVDSSIQGLTSSALKYAAAAGAIVAIAKKSIDAYGVQEQAEKRLEVAYKGNTSALKAQAAALQQVSTFGDEMILGVQASIAAFVDSEDAIMKATAATLDLAAATGMDLKAAGDLVAKSLGSSTNALSRYGIEVTGAVGSTERLDTLVGNIADKFDGQAAAAADTMAGSIEQAKNAMGDAAEVIGAALSPAVTVLARGIKGSVELLFNLRSEMDKLEEKSKTFQQGVGIPTIEEARANKLLVEQMQRMIAEHERLSRARTKMKDLQIETNIATADSIPLLREQSEIVNDLSTIHDSNAAAMLESGLIGVAMASDMREASRALANQYIVEGVFGYVKSALETIPFPFGLLAAGAAATGANALFNNIIPTRAASEFEGTVDRPTMFIAGDNAGALGETVSIKHNDGQSNSGGTVHVYIDTMIGTKQFARDSLIPMIEDSLRKGYA